MKSTTLTTLLAPALVTAQWWGGAPECAQPCFSSLWSSATSDSAWPAPTNYCGATQAASVSSCINSACSATPTAITSYGSLSSSLCSQWASCTSAGSTGVYTVSVPAFTGAWGGPGHGAGNGHWKGGDDGDDWTKTWTGGVYTVTGCEWNGNPWAGGPGGWGHGGADGSPWAPWGKGWKWSTATQTVTQVITTDGAVTTSVGLATVGLAVSGDVTTTSILTGERAQATGNVGGRNDVDAGVKVMGVVLGGVVAVAGML
ncbi:hypothetical protein QBC42DRAFT_275127 [Cladorrhinum samala]|uniref:Extracellular membrane protein CFEM domain-containing protein n=1 Tax=Cladorrhinum samala TaxID=585594 RepID=A0AAV9HH01_9PEZI|nr:hypothetical protein QBC42DRAFT_275127 [Cladorrhinum samala]